jgi:hypothetical protein
MSTSVEEEVETEAPSTSGRSTRTTAARARRKNPPIIGRKVGLTPKTETDVANKKAINQLTSAFSHIHEIGKDPYPKNFNRDR